MSLATDIEEAIVKIAASAIEAALKGSDTALDDAQFEAELDAHRIVNEHIADLELFEKWKAQQKLGGG